MGKTPSVQECLHHLNISILSSVRLKRDAVDFFHEKDTPPYYTLPSERLRALIQRYINSPKYRERQRTSSESKIPSSSSDESQWFLRLVKNWIKEDIRDESTKNPPYSTGKTQKRKRQDDEAREKRLTRDRPTSQHLAENVLPLQESSSAGLLVATASSSDQPAPKGLNTSDEDGNSNELSFASAVEIPREEATADLSGQIAGLGDSVPVPGRSTLRQIHQSRNMIDIEDMDDDQETVRAFSEIRDFAATAELPRQPRPHPQILFQASVQSATQNLPARDRVEDSPEPNESVPATNKTNDNEGNDSDDSDDDESQDEDQNEPIPLDSIVEYIGLCENHNLRRASDESISAAERQNCRIRAATFANLIRDIESRALAVRDSRNREGELQVTSYCLWF